MKMEDEDRPPVEQPEPIQPKRNMTFTFIIVIFLLMASIAFFYYQNKQLTIQQTKQAQEITDTYMKLDSISHELDERIQTITSLGGDIKTLTELKEQLEEDKRDLLKRDQNQQKQIARLNQRVNGYKELLVMKDKEIAKLEALNQQLSDENITLKVEKNQLNDSIQQLGENTKILESKVATAAKLEIKDMKVTAINERGKEREGGEYKNKQIKKLKIQFTVLKNDIAPIEGKELLLRVVDPDGNVLFDVKKGSGSFTYQQRELFYTAKQEVLYDQKSQKVTFFYDKGSKYAIGKHKIEVYTDDYMMGEGNFVIK